MHNFIYFWVFCISQVISWEDRLRNVSSGCGKPYSSYLHNKLSYSDTHSCCILPA